jgi:hypothetical protein
MVYYYIILLRWRVEFWCLVCYPYDCVLCSTESATLLCTIVWLLVGGGAGGSYVGITVWYLHKISNIGFQLFLCRLDVAPFIFFVGIYDMFLVYPLLVLYWLLLLLP